MSEHHLDNTPPLPALRGWFCLRSQPKHEYIAAAQLRQLPDLEVFLPRIRFQRLTRQGRAWVTEALFPGYLFARFEFETCLRKVHHARGVRQVVHFGDKWPTIPDDVIEQLRATLGNESVHVLSDTLEAGETVKIAAGAFHGLEAVVTRVMPGRQRVAVLLEFLGRQTAVEVSRDAVVRDNERKFSL